MTKLKSCSIKLLTKSYALKCPEHEEANLLRAAEKLDEYMQANKNKLKQPDDFKCLLLAALDISRELILCQKEQEQQRMQVTQFISTLESKINKTMGGDVDNMPQTD